MPGSDDETSPVFAKRWSAQLHTAGPRNTTVDRDWICDYGQGVGEVDCGRAGTELEVDHVRARIAIGIEDRLSQRARAGVVRIDHGEEGLGFSQHRQRSLALTEIEPRVVEPFCRHSADLARVGRDLRWLQQVAALGKLTARAGTEVNQP